MTIGIYPDKPGSNRPARSNNPLASQMEELLMAHPLVSHASVRLSADGSRADATVLCRSDGSYAEVQGFIDQVFQQFGVTP